MSKSKKITHAPQHEKGFMEIAGDAIHTLGQEIVEGKDKLVAVTVETFTDVKEAVKNKFAKKKIAVKKAVKKAAPKKKTVAKKAAVVKKAAKKIAKKVVAKKK